MIFPINLRTPHSNSDYTKVTMLVITVNYIFSYNYGELQLNITHGSLHCVCCTFAVFKRFQWSLFLFIHDFNLFYF